MRMHPIDESPEERGFHVLAITVSDTGMRLALLSSSPLVGDIERSALYKTRS